MLNLVKSSLLISMKTPWQLLIYRGNPFGCLVHMRGMDGACWCPDLAPLKLTGDPWRSQVTFLCDGLRAEWVRLVQSPAVSCFPWLVEEALCWNSGLKDQSSLAHRRATWRDAQEWACKNGIIFSHRDAVCYCGITSLCWLTEQLSQGGLRDHAVMDGSPSWPRVRLAVSWPEQPRTPTDRYSHSLLDLFETMGKLNWHPAEWLLACHVYCDWKICGWPIRRLR